VKLIIILVLLAESVAEKSLDGDAARTTARVIECRQWKKLLKSLMEVVQLLQNGVKNLVLTQKL
jgi:hypothetical protein